MFGTRSYSDFGNCILGALLILVVLSTCCLSSSTITMDSMLQNQTISDGQTLVSANETFTLGFFSPGASTYRYVGIWYGNVPNRTVVWVANRNNPILDDSGVLMFDKGGNLVILDFRGSSFTVAYGSGAKDTEATILDTGNLVLRNVSNCSTVIWQSFDSPTDTWLPGMKLGLVGGQNHLLTSWRSSDDPATGDYSFGMDPNREKTRFFIWERGHVSWSSRLRNGDRDEYDFIKSQNVSVTFFSKDDEKYLSYIAKPGGIIRYVLDFSGQVKLQERMDFVVHQWLLLGSWPGGICKIFSPCGAFGICDENEQNLCKCPKGFTPGDGIGWSTGDTRRGCIRQISLDCAGDKFLQMPNMGLPGNASTLTITGQKQCESTCLTICSCTAYALAQDGCSLWFGNLMQLREGQSGDAVGTLYLRLAASELESRGAPVILIASIVSSIAFLIFVALLFLLCIRRRKSKGQGKLHGHSLLTLDTDGASKLWESKETGRQFTLFRFSEIASATGNFSPENKLGEGGFGPVYCYESCGNLPEGQEIAVKRLAAHSGQGLLEFKNEILLIAKLQHRNLVRLLGCCIHGDEKILIYEYMPNKSLDFFLFEQSRSTMLDWATRIYIIEGIAQGLLYLHKHSRLRIIHRDLKASNILLDIDMNPKISDFGMARIFCSEETQANTNRVVGTYGYMAPEYAMEGIFSVKSDVFSFGVLLLEIVSGIRNAGFHQRGGSINLLGFAWQLWKEGRWSELVDPAPGDTCAGHKVVRCIHVSLMCVQENAVDRPTMTEVISMLTNESTTLPDPKQPAFLSIGAPTDTDVNGGTCSLNDMTITDPHGR